MSGFLFWSLSAFTALVFAPIFYVLIAHGAEVLRMMHDQSGRRTIAMFREKGWMKDQVDRFEKRNEGQE